MSAFAAATLPMTNSALSRRLRRRLHLLCLLAGLASPLYSATYYIDHLDGDDRADGLTPRSAWKHAPGDKAATGNPSAASLAPGDTVLFKGGVAYLGSLTIAVSGQPGNPITYDGNSEGSFGVGRAILDGGRVVANWRPAASADEVGGNPRWRDIFHADIDVDVTPNTRHDQVVLHRQTPPDLMAPWQRVILIDGSERVLPVARIPKPKDPFFIDLPEDFYLSPRKLAILPENRGTLLADPERLSGLDTRAFADVMLGVHGGNNHVYFAPIRSYDPVAASLIFPEFTHNIYDQTRYAFYNSARFIEQPGEWSVTPLGDGRSRVHLLPSRTDSGPPADIAYPAHGTAITVIDGHSHLRIQGFLIQRYSGDQGGVSVARHNRSRSRDIIVADNEIRFISGHAGVGVNYADDITVQNNVIHHCPGWTTGVFLNRVSEFRVTDNRLDKNSGSGIRLYEGTDGSIARNMVLEHYGMHSSGLNLYEGCTDVVVEDNFIENVIVINRNAERLVLRNNIVDAQNRNPVTLAIWASGRTRGNAARDIRIIGNTFVNTAPDTSWSAGLFGQSRAGVPVAEGLVVRDNIMDRPGGALSGVFENNLYLRPAAPRFTGPGTQVVPDMDTLFRDPAQRDVRRKPGGPLPSSGADLQPPPAG